MRFCAKKWPILAPRAGRYCVTATVTPVLKLSVDIIKLTKCVLKTFGKVFQALDRPKRTAGSRDMVFLAKTR